MAKVYLSEVIQNIRGSVKNHTFSCWKGRAILKQKAVSASNPCSFDQAGLRSTLAAVSRQWYANLTERQRDLWNEYAQGLKSASEQVGPNANGGAGMLQVIPEDGGVMSGYNAFVRAQLNALSAGYPPGAPYLPEPGPTVTDPNPPTELSGVYCFDSYQGVIRLSWTDPLGYFGDERIRIWLVSTDAGVHRQLVLNVVTGEEVAPVFNVNIAQGQPTPINLLPGHYLVQVDCMSIYGVKSAPSNTIQIEVTEAVPPGC